MARAVFTPLVPAFAGTTRYALQLWAPLPGAV